MYSRNSQVIAINNMTRPAYSPLPGHVRNSFETLQPFTRTPQSLGTCVGLVG